MSAVEAAASPAGARQNRITLVVAASCAGTVFEWYDFFIFGSLAAIIAAHFFTHAGTSQGYVFALLTFAAGFAVRPLGALVFGRLGDRHGRKRAFLVTITLMGLATVDRLRSCVKYLRVPRQFPLNLKVPYANRQKHRKFASALCGERRI